MARGWALDLRHKAILRGIVHATWIGGLVLFAALGLVARHNLAARGIPVVTLPEGAALLLPLALLFEIPVWVHLALVHRGAVRAIEGVAGGFAGEYLALVAPCIPAGDPRAFWPLATALAASGAGALGALGYVMFRLMLFHGPGGFAQVVMAAVMAFPMTFAFLLLIGFVGAVAGGGLATLAVRIVAALGHRHA